MRSIAQEILALAELSGSEARNFRPAVATIGLSATLGNAGQQFAFTVPKGKSFLVTAIEAASFAMGEDGNPIFSTYRKDFYGEPWTIILVDQATLLPVPDGMIGHYLIDGPTFSIFKEGRTGFYIKGSVSAPAVEAFSMYLTLRFSGYIIPAAVGDELSQFQQTTLPR